MKRIIEVDRMRERLSRLMQGRYGTDHLNRFIIGFSMIVLLISIITGWRIFYSVGLILMVLSYFRLFSRNISSRYQENQKYLAMKNRFLSMRPKAWLSTASALWNRVCYNQEEGRESALIVELKSEGFKESDGLITLYDFMMLAKQKADLKSSEVKDKLIKKLKKIKL